MHGHVDDVLPYVHRQACVRHELRRGEAVGLREWGTLWAVLEAELRFTSLPGGSRISRYCDFRRFIILRLENV